MNRQILRIAISLTAGVSAISCDAFGQTAVVPGQLSQLPAAPTAQTEIPELRIDQPSLATERQPQGDGVLVHSLRLSGQTRFSQDELIKAAGFTPDRSLRLSDLRQMAARITRHYNARGYLVAQAYVPAQTVRDGSVTISVIEGRYGAIKLNNASRLTARSAQTVLNGVESGDLIAAAPLERRLLLLSDLPGVRVNATLAPGSAVGTSDLLLDVTPGRRVSGNIEASNAGSPYTGAYQGGGTINVNEPLGVGDVASLRVLTSGEGLQYGRASYQAQAGNVTLGAAYAHFHYRLGKQFKVLDANGHEDIASVYASYPLIRSYDNNLQARVQFDYRVFQDRIDAFATVSDRRAEVVILGLAGDHRDRFAGGGWDSYTVDLTMGNLDLRTPLVRTADAATARTDGRFGKLRFSADRLQTLTGPFSAYGAIRGQVAFNNLDIAEKMELGGAYAVRAYPEGEAYGDEGYVATAEVRLLLPPVAGLIGRLQLAAFYDFGQVWLNKDPWLEADNSLTRDGAGASLTWAENGDFLARVSYAFQMGPEATSYSPGSDGQFRFELVKFF